jgi:tight adherence protein B
MLGTVSITVLCGVVSFFGLFLTFDYWFERIWENGMLRVHMETVRVCEAIFVRKAPSRIMSEQLVVAGGVSLLFFLFMWPYLMISLPVCAFVFYHSWKLPLLYYARYVRPKRIGLFSVQMVDALTLMANGLKSGLNVPQTVQIVVDEMPNPIKEEFNLVLTENKIGLTFEKAFENLAVRIPSEDVNMFVTSVNILRETGGNIAETFDTICKTIRERLKLQAKISAMVAQGLMSAIIVGSMPWALGVMLYMIDPERMKPMFTHPLGWAILLGILVLEGVGIFIILKIVRIRV